MAKVQAFSNYQPWLAELKTRIRVAQTRAALAVNSEMVLLYWSIGRDILDRQAREGWGTKVVDQLAADLRNEFPDMTGFSPRNLKYMRAFAQTWADAQFVQAVLAQLPWYHQIALLDKLKVPSEREWYARAAIEHGWSRNILVHQIETRVHERQGLAITNFKQTLPAPQSELVQRLIKDPLIFDFLRLGPEAKERDLENGLIAHLKEFLLELGKGFVVSTAAIDGST